MQISVNELRSSRLALINIVLRVTYFFTYIFKYRCGSYSRLTKNNRKLASAIISKLKNFETPLISAEITNEESRGKPCLYKCVLVIYRFVQGRKLSVRATEKIRIGKPAWLWTLQFILKRTNEPKDGILSVYERGSNENRHKTEIEWARTFNSYISLFDTGRQITAAPITTVDPIVFYFYKSIHYKSNRKQ